MIGPLEESKRQEYLQALEASLAAERSSDFEYIVEITAWIFGSPCWIILQKTDDPLDQVIKRASKWGIEMKQITRVVRSKDGKEMYCRE